MTATCSSCQRVFEVSEAMMRAVQDGTCECLCGHCDGSHDDHSNVNEDGMDDS